MTDFHGIDIDRVHFMRRAAKIDANQPEIVKALEKIGATVKSLAAVHDGTPDLLVGYRGTNYLMEVKDGSRPPSERRLTPDQERFRDGWKGQWAKVETVEDALEVIRGA